MRFFTSLKWCLQMNVVMYGNYIFFYFFIFYYEWMYNLCDYLTYWYVFFFFFSNNVRSYNTWSDSTIHDLTYLSWFYVGSWFWQHWREAWPSKACYRHLWAWPIIIWFISWISIWFWRERNLILSLTRDKETLLIKKLLITFSEPLVGYSKIIKTNHI